MHTTSHAHPLRRRGWLYIAVALAMAIGMLASFMLASPRIAGANGTTVQYTGQGTHVDEDGNRFLDSEQCDPDNPVPYLLWILTASGADSATITINGETFDMTQQGQGQGSFRYVSDFYDLNTVIASAEYQGTVRGKVQLVISHGCPALNLEVSKTADTSFTRTYEWDIEKSADKTELNLEEGDLATVNYEVTVDLVNSEDSDFKVFGTITIHNPHGTAATVTSISDILEEGMIAVIDEDCDVPFDIPAGGTVECDYVAELTEPHDGTNTVVVETEGAIGGGTATDDYAFGGPTTLVDECIDVYDNNVGQGFLGEVCVGDELPTTFKYSLTFGLHDDADVLLECGENIHDNKAYFYDGAGNKHKSTWTVIANVECKAAEWCSPGYWRQEHHLDSWAATGYSPDDFYNDYFDPDLDGNPTLWEVLQSPQTYGGAAFNNVGDLLSAAHPDVNFTGERVEDSCPLN